MIKFFRKIRQRLLAENRFSKYLVYAAGEIILVVIGILIALQINNWNIKAVNDVKEHNYLLEIKSNLASDIVKLDSILAFNKAKDSVIAETYRLLSKPQDFTDPEIVGNHISVLGSYEFFRPNDIGFQNLVSAENIGLLQNNELRKQLLEFYSVDFVSGTQKRVEDVTRRFVDYVAPKISTKEYFNWRYKVDLDIIKDSQVDLSKDQQFFSLLEMVSVVTDFQNDMVKDAKKDVENITNNIANYLNEND